MIKHFFSPKRQRIIQAVKDYYDGSIEYIPFSNKEIKEVADWVEGVEIPNKEMLLAKLNMAQLIKTKR